MPFVCSLALLLTSAGAEEWNKTYAISGHAQVRVRTNDGSVSVVPGKGRQVEARVITRGYSIGPGGVTVDERQSGDVVDIEVREPRMMHFAFGSRSVRIELIVPQDCDLKVKSGDGGIRIESLNGRLELETGDGGIEAKDVSGTLTAHSGDGGIRVKGRLDSLDIHTGDGGIEAELAQGSKMHTPWRISTGDGSVRLRLPSDFAADVDVRTGDGRIHADVPMQVSGTMSRKQVRGKMNGGGALLTVKSGDGSVYLARN